MSQSRKRHHLNHEGDDVIDQELGTDYENASPFLIAAHAFLISHGAWKTEPVEGKLDIFENDLADLLRRFDAQARAEACKSRIEKIHSLHGALMGILTRIDFSPGLAGGMGFWDAVKEARALTGLDAS